MHSQAQNYSPFTLSKDDREHYVGLANLSPYHSPELESQNILRVCGDNAELLFHFIEYHYIADFRDIRPLLLGQLKIKAQSRRPCGFTLLRLLLCKG